jgi:MFS family permease
MMLHMDLSFPTFVPPPTNNANTHSLCYLLTDFPRIIQLELSYHKNYTVISLVFLSPFLGYTVSAILSNLIHQRLGRRGVAFIGPACHLLAFAVISTNPPFPVLVIMYIFVGLGSGIQNAGWNVWISSLANSHEVLGCFHGFYGVGATVSPLVATTLITKAGWEWNTFYYLLVCIEIPRRWPSSP